MKLHRYLLPLVVLAAGCAAPAPPPSSPPIPMSELPDINTEAILGDIRKLSSDELEGRAPGGKGEELAVQYMIDQLKAAGLEPGNPDGGWTQRVPLIDINPLSVGPFVVKNGGQVRNFKVRDEVVVFSDRIAKEAKIENSELVFVGYGVQAPEYQWDDFKGVDVKGKTIVVLVNDPPIATADGKLDDKMFGGKAMTYYGRWTYKYEKAAQLGAAGAIIVHETIPAGYPFSVVKGFGSEHFNLETPDKNAGLAAIQGWISLEAAKELMKMAGQDYEKLKEQAKSRDFKPVPLGMTASSQIKQSLKMVDSKNVVAKLTGSDPKLKDEVVIYTAHWDHLGVGESVKGDKIYNGAIDNASGVAGVMEIAREFTKIKTKPRRSILFLLVTAEEQGLLGSQYYSDFPLYPVAKSAANINLDGMNQWGRTKDLILVGLGASDLDDYARTAAAEQGRMIAPDAEPEKGFYYRSDHFNFAKKGVPALDPDSGVEYIGKPEGYGKTKREEYTNNDYHSPSDEVKPDWDLSGAAEDAKLFLAVGYRVAQAEKLPEWKPGNEFKSIRDKSLGR